MDQGIIRNLKAIYRRNLLFKLVEEGYDDLHSFWKNLTVLDAIYYVDSGWKLVKSSTVKKSWRVILSDKENEMLHCSKNVDEEAMEQWTNEDSTLECCEVLSGDDIMARVRTLFVSGLPMDAKPRELYLLFRAYKGYEGSLLKVTSKNGKTSSPVGFVTFTTRAGAEAAKQDLQDCPWLSDRFSLELSTVIGLDPKPFLVDPL
ncbi:Protein couch potato [Araneus ventricosus]|uniref:Protein couch potato n=1 Tax=Araneus ventricosus TaxID=182803 RepID=A0A4Y2E8F6_ARAVE|nr:Protein couch potato [Araneus ventricosus]